ncbi:MAG TPA: HDIG domain-containing protein [Acidimicrobiia bacterium]|nr:HDIG domain-containing protein [Acidimicrobiia bacterium]
MKRSTLVRGAIFLATCFGVWGVLSIGAGADTSALEVGDLADRTYEAQRPDEVPDSVATEQLEQQARDSVEPIWEDNPEAEQAVQTDVTDLFADVAGSVVADPPSQPTPPTLPFSTTTTTDPGASSTTTTVPADPVVLTGVVYVDVDSDGVFAPEAEVPRPDRGLERISVTITSEAGEETVMSGPGGVWSYETVTGDYVVDVDVEDADIPTGFAALGEEGPAELVSCPTAGEQCVARSVGFAPNLNPIADVVAEISERHALAADASATLVGIAADDVIRAALGHPLRLTVIERQVTDRILQEFGLGVRNDDLLAVRARARNSPPAVFFDDTGRDEAAGQAAGEIVATLIQANEVINQDRTTQEQDLRAEAVEDVIEEYTAGQLIVDQNQPLTQLHIDAISATGANPGEVEQEGGLLAVVAVLIGVLGLYLSTFRLEFWARPRMVALLAILIVLAAAAARGTVIAEPEVNWYVFPAVAFGFVTAVLFDSRIAVLMALSVGVLTAVGTQDIGVSVYAVLATMAPIPFVSSVSSRGAFRNAVIFSSFTAAIAAAATSWFFHVGPNDDVLDVVGTSSVWAFGVSVVASLVGLAALQFFESAFDITTTLSLLDLTDRNHEALQLLQEEAFGSFNHSLMVGTLSHAAARAINANALLARAMAYYHDIGKTENPTYFIENQFGGSNPHDLLSPKESAEIIRRHVTDGVALARRYKIPSDVTMGIVSHHGDGIMRFFYEKAKSQGNDEVDPNDFRHVGHKPRTAESAIVMLADSLEAACRAEFQTQEASPLAIEKVVDRVIDEKMDDGQLSESPLTLSDITKIRGAFLESLIGHYHQRIAYPNFPGS